MYSSRITCECAKKAKETGSTYFGIQYYGECWSDADAVGRYSIYGPADNCVGADYKQCNDKDDMKCSGKEQANYVYQIEPGRCTHF